MEEKGSLRKEASKKSLKGYTKEKSAFSREELLTVQCMSISECLVAILISVRYSENTLMLGLK